MSLNVVAQKSWVQTVTTGFNVTIPDGITLAILNSTIALLAGTVNLPASPSDGQPLTIESPKGIVALNLAPGSSQTISGNTISAAAANAPIRLKYAAINSTWYPN